MRYAGEGYHNLERTERTRGRADVSGDSMTGEVLTLPL